VSRQTCTFNTRPRVSGAVTVKGSEEDPVIITLSTHGPA
jgi:hypothetical protein